MPPLNEFPAARLPVPAQRQCVAASAAAHARFWQTLEDCHDVAPAAGDASINIVSWGRRRFLGVMGASLALAGTVGCSRTPLEKIVPYRTGPSELTYGAPVFYATAIARDGYGVGVLVETNMGRPTKIEGNPQHTASLGATDAITQAAVLELWDPDRSKQIRRGREFATWEQFNTEIDARVAQSAAGKSLRLLTETVTSPTLWAQIAAVLERVPGARWHQYQPVHRDNVYDGSRLALGVPMETTYQFGAAKIVVALDADIVAGMPGSVRYAHDIAEARRRPGSMPRLYVAEGTPSLTGALADERRPTRSGDMAALALSLASRLEVVDGVAPRRGDDDAWLKAAAADLRRHRGASIVVAGDRQPAAVHALVQLINAELGNVGATVEVRAAVACDAASQSTSLAALIKDMQAGNVESLLILEANPAYHAPVDLGFQDALASVPWTARLGLYEDETSRQCTWHVPAAHVLEAWSDIRAYDGTATIQQPCIAPLYDGRSAHELLACVLGMPERSNYDIVRDYWRTQRPDDFEAFWHKALYTGSVAMASDAPRHRVFRDRILAAASAAATHTFADESLEISLFPDPTVGDGRYANNAWLQELPKPLTTLTWDNAALIAPALAKRLGLSNEDVVSVERNGRSVRAPVWIMPGHVDGAVTLYLGNGRTHAGAVGNGVGTDANPLRTSNAPWFAPGVTLSKTAARYPLAPTQAHSRMEGRDLVRVIGVGEASICATSPPCPPAHDTDPRTSLYPEFTYDDYRWGMSIDLSSCIGCSACTVACQAENNIAVVGKAEVRNGRELHWIRVDRYYSGTPDLPRTVFQPVPCMQCEHAPCEEVCPVEASVHDAEGLNVQVYNRCVGTRFCSNNCPYKVRRFNFFDYVNKAPAAAAQRNPEVTVRIRGVMEKCSYCVQRIANARSDADRENRRIVDGEVVTACQAVCPTRAIVFGDLNDPDSAVSRRKASPLDYSLLAELNTRPRTTYLPKVTNPASDVESR